MADGLLRLADVLTPNETEFAALLSRHVGERVEPDAVAALDGASLHGLCRKLLPHGTVVITLLRHDSVDDAFVPDAQAFRPERWLGEDGLSAYRAAYPELTSTSFAAGALALAFTGSLSTAGQWALAVLAVILDRVTQAMSRRARAAA